MRKRKCRRITSSGKITDSLKRRILVIQKSRSKMKRTMSRRKMKRTMMTMTCTSALASSGEGLIQKFPRAST